MPSNAVISLPDLETIYEVPLALDEEGIDKIITDKLQLEKNKPNLSAWKKVVKRKIKPSKSVNVKRLVLKVKCACKIPFGFLRLK